MLLGVYTHIDNMVSLNLLFSFVLKVLLAFIALLLFLQTCLFGNGARHHFFIIKLFSNQLLGEFSFTLVPDIFFREVHRFLISLF